jgi:hypothetical protein
MIKSMKKQQGVMLIGIMMASVALVIMLQIGKFALQKVERQRMVGSDAKVIAQHNTAVRQKVTSEGTAIPAGIYNGVNWLKQTGTCAGGTSTLEFLPCIFSDRTDLGFTYSTTIVHVGAETTATTTYGTPASLGVVRPDITRRIRIAANSGDESTQTPLTDTWYNFPNDSTTAVLTGVVKNAPAIAAWLRADGSVSPTANFNWTGQDLTNIDELSVNTNITSLGTITSVGDIGTLANLNANGALDVGGSATIGSNLQVNGSTNSNGTISSGGDINATGSLNSQFWRDSNNGGFYVDGDNETRLNTMRLFGTLFSWSGANYLDLDSWSYLKYVQTDLLYITGVYAVGGGCTSGMIGRQADGEALTCVNGVFRKVTGFSGYEIITNARSANLHYEVTATCSAGKVVMGGGCYQGTSTNVAMVNSYPAGFGNQWTCRTRDTNVITTRTTTVYALCAFL